MGADPWVPRDLGDESGKFGFRLVARSRAAVRRRRRWHRDGVGDVGCVKKEKKQRREWRWQVMEAAFYQLPVGNREAKDGFSAEDQKMQSWLQVQPVKQVAWDDEHGMRIS
ncbi:hypothetical protein CDL15_Pgr010660 [Punica granatum]|uniref:Uncharacterized protein n=1 Tax=Punica granatum TaxID=22663 RepID=A0A218VT44_PUNGR|nr:hypothetical protein CDL15_Pgr010660 [Punica granatum]